MAYVEDQSELLTPRFQIVWTSYQIIAQTHSTLSNVTYPRLFDYLREGLSVVTIAELTIYVPAACVNHEYNFYSNLVVVTGLPLLLCFVITVHGFWVVMGSRLLNCFSIRKKKRKATGD